MKKLILLMSLLLSLSLLFSCGDDEDELADDDYAQDIGADESGDQQNAPYIGPDGHWYIGDVDTGIVAIGKNGSDGQNGLDGANGLTPYIGENGNWFIGETDTGIAAVGLDGDDGKDGTDGLTPYIGENGNWFIGNTDTGVSAGGKNGNDGIAGSDGADGLTPYIGENGNWFIGDTDTGVSAGGKNGNDGIAGVNGIDGITPHIGENGNWFIGDTDTGVLAAGKNGIDGVPGINGIDGVTPHIGENGNWFIGDTDTGVLAKGTNGTNGIDGSAGKNGVDGVDGLTPYIGENNNWFIGDEDTGIKAIGIDGSNGENGISILKVEIIGGSLFVTYSDNPDSAVEVGKIKAEIAPEAELEFYPLPDGTLGVKAGKALYSKEITIPESYGGVKVTEILPDAFKGAKYLENITIPDTVIKISSGAFSDCPMIVSVFIPKTVRYIETGAFSLEENSLVCLERSSASSGFDDEWYSSTTRIVYDCVSDIQYQDGIGFLIHSDETATVVCYNGSSYQANIPETVAGRCVDAIGDCAFKNNARLLSVIIPQTVNHIGTKAFASSRLKEVYDLSGKLQGVSFDVYNSIEVESKLVDTNDGFVFYGTELVDYYGESETVVLPERFQGRSYTIGSYAFSASAAKVVTADYGTLCNEINRNALTGSNIESFEVPTSVKKIHENAFSCETLVAVTFDLSFTWIVGNSEAFMPSADAEENLAKIMKYEGKIFNRID